MSAPRQTRNSKSISRKEKIKKEVRRLVMFVMTFCFATVFGVFSHYINTASSAEVVSTVEEGEEVEIEVYEVIEVESLDPLDVAMWFVDNDTKLLQHFLEYDLDAVEAEMKNRHEYARGIMLHQLINEAR